LAMSDAGEAVAEVLERLRWRMIPQDAGPWCSPTKTGRCVAWSDAVCLIAPRGWSTSKRSDGSRRRSNAQEPRLTQVGAQLCNDGGGLDVRPGWG